MTAAREVILPSVALNAPGARQRHGLGADLSVHGPGNQHLAGRDHPFDRAALADRQSVRFDVAFNPAVDQNFAVRDQVAGYGELGADDRLYRGFVAGIPRPRIFSRQYRKDLQRSRPQGPAARRNPQSNMRPRVHQMPAPSLSPPPLVLSPLDRGRRFGGVDDLA